MEDEYPGLWRLWFKNQCVTDGHSPYDGERWLMDGGKRKRRDDWAATRKALKEIKLEDLIVVALPDRRIGRIGKVVDIKVRDDDWEPLVPGDAEWEEGYMGRRILVRWELECAPDSWEQVIQVPEGVNMRWRGTLHRINKPSLGCLQKVIADPVNWVKMTGDFGYERALSDYIARFPHRLKDGLEPYPNKEIREYVFDDDSRADVLLRDADGKPVIVECKRESPDEESIRQLRRYIKRLKDKTGEQASGILVHGGARAVDKKVWHEAKKSPHVEIFQYKLDVDFVSSC